MPVENTTPSVNKRESYHLKANGTIPIFEVTDNTPLFVDGIRGKALQMHAYYKDAVRFANTENISSKQFSVSFWVKTSAGDDFTYGRIISHADTIGKSGWFLDVKNSTRVYIAPWLLFPEVSVRLPSNFQIPIKFLCVEETSVDELVVRKTSFTSFSVSALS